MNIKQFINRRRLWVVEFYDNESYEWKPSVHVSLTRDGARALRSERSDLHRMLKIKSRIVEYKRVSLAQGGLA